MGFDPTDQEQIPPQATVVDGIRPTIAKDLFVERDTGRVGPNQQEVGSFGRYRLCCRP